MEVVLLNALDAHIAVIAYGRNGSASFQGKGDPGMAERVPGQRFSAGHFDLSAVVAVVLGPGGKTRFNEHLL